MKITRLMCALTLTLMAIGEVQAQSPSGSAVPVTVENFARAEFDRIAASFVSLGGFGKFFHQRELVRLDRQIVIRPNRDTLYSEAVFDLSAGSVTISLPNAGNRYMSMMVIDEDQFIQAVVYGAGTYTISEQNASTRYIGVAMRILVDPTNPNDLEEVHALQDAIKVSQNNPGRFEVPNWDQTSRKKIHDALLVLWENLPDTTRMFGTKDQVDPVRHLIGTAALSGGLPEKDAFYPNVTPGKNDGTTILGLKVKEVPVDGFWSISVYNTEGYIQPNRYNAYSLNNITATKGTDGSVAIQFGGCDGKLVNCLPIMPGWNYTVRFYRPHAEILDGKWSFPQAKPIN
jgi:hypothetical protein